MKYILSLLLVALALPVLANDADIDVAKDPAVLANYKTHCASCHHIQGTGRTTMGRKIGAKDFTDPKVIAEFTDEKAMKNLKDGVKDKAGKEIKKSFTGKLTEDEMKALVKYTRTFAKK